MEDILFPEYFYTLPKNLIAHEPQKVRDASRILVYDTTKEEVYFDVFAHSAQYLPQNSMMVLNDTTVVPARVRGTIAHPKDTRSIEMIFLINEIGHKSTEGIALIPNKIARGKKITIGTHMCTVLGKEREGYMLTCSAPIEDILWEYGTTPIPPYIHTSLIDSELQKRYQTIFAAQGASAAAPTASNMHKLQTKKSLQLVLL